MKFFRTPKNRPARAADIAAKQDGVKIRSRHIPNDWDDKHYSRLRDKSWKLSRNTQYRTVNV